MTRFESRSRPIQVWPSGWVWWMRARVSSLASSTAYVTPAAVASVPVVPVPVVSVPVVSVPVTPVLVATPSVVVPASVPVIVT